MNACQRLLSAAPPKPSAVRPDSPVHPPPPPQEQTFSDSNYHRQGREEAHERAGTPRHSGNYDSNTFGIKTKKTRTGNRRWSYVLQDILEIATAALNDINRGYVMRLAAVAGVTLSSGALLYSLVLAPSQEKKPLAKRWTLLTPKVPITLIERHREGSSQMYIYRFALPNSYDYAGYEPVSSVRLYSGRVRELSSLARWYTPISHPEERGFIEFAIKDCDPGRMSSRLRYLEPGDVVYLGRWMKEFDYAQAVREGGEIGLVCTTSGASIALQLMKIMEHEQRTAGAAAATTPAATASGGPPVSRLRMLYCHQSARDIPFKASIFNRYEAAMPGRLSIKYNVSSVGTRSAGGVNSIDKSLVVGGNCFVGNIDPAILEAALPPPVRTTPDGQRVHRPHILVCGPQSMMSYVCGRVSPLSNYTYWQGWWFRYTGFLKDMGYERSQVYKFGVSTHFLAIH